MPTPEPDASFESYVHARNAALSRIAYLLTGDHHLAEDLVQQTLLQVVGHWKRIAKAGDPDAYVRRVLYHQHISWWRRRRHHEEILGDVPNTSIADPSEEVVATVAVRKALAQLAPRQRAVLVLRYFEDLSESQAAEVLGVSVGTVKSQARDGLARLRLLAPDLNTMIDIEVRT